MSRSYDHRDRRGRHRRHGSPETQAFHELERSLQVGPWIPPAKPKRAKPGPPPKRPVWMPREVYADLVALRKTL